MALCVNIEVVIKYSGLIKYSEHAQEKFSSDYIPFSERLSKYFAKKYLLQRKYELK